MMTRRVTIRDARSLGPAIVLAVFLSGCGGRQAALEEQYEWVAANPNAPAPVKRAVLGRKLVDGMNEDAVVASWGDPKRKLDLGGGDSRWTYRKSQIINNMRVVIEYTLIFNRGILVRVLKERAR